MRSENLGRGKTGGRIGRKIIGELGKLANRKIGRRIIRRAEDWSKGNSSETQENGNNKCGVYTIFLDLP